MVDLEREEKFGEGWRIVERELKLKKGRKDWWFVGVSGKKFIMKEVDEWVFEKEEKIEF